MASDSCAGATVISSLPYSETGLDNTTATTTGGEVAAASGDGTVAGAGPLYRSLWWTYTPASNQRVKFASTEAQQVVAVFTGACGSLTEVASYGPLTLNLTAGTAYKICVASFTDTGYAFDFSAAVTTDPANQHQATATVLTSLPFTDSPDLSDATDNIDGFNNVYYRYTAVAGDLMLGFFAYAASFDTQVTVFTGNADVYDGNAATSPAMQVVDVAFQYPLTAGTTYYFRVTKDSGTAGVVAVNVQPGPTSAVGASDILITDDGEGFPAIVLDRQSGEPLRFVDVPAGDQGDVLDNGNILLDDNEDDKVHLYDKNFTELVDLGTLGVSALSKHNIRMSPGLQTFYVGRGGDSGGPTNASIYAVSAAGVVTATWTLPAVGLVALAPNNDGSIVYVGGQTSSSNTPIKAWQTGSSTFGTDLIGGQGATTAVTDLLVLSDGSIIAQWLDSGGGVSIKRLSAAGATLGTLSSLTSPAAGPRLSYDGLTRSTWFWAWTHGSDGQSTFHRIETAGMNVVETITSREYLGGVYNGSETATPDARFGNDRSCPFIFLRTTKVPDPTDPSEPCCAEPCSCPPATPTGSPSGAPIPTATGPILPPVVLTDWTPWCTGGGDVPTAADATDAESWVS